VVVEQLLGLIAMKTLKHSMQLQTVGELRESIKDIPDNTLVCHVSKGYNQVLRNDVSFYYGAMPTVDHSRLQIPIGTRILLVGC
jgi:hypothetical protein